MHSGIKSAVSAASAGFLTLFTIHAASVSDYDVVWDSPSKDCHGSMPIGNGDIGANVWVEENGDLCFFLSKTDAIDEHARFVKLGKVRVRLTPNPFVKDTVFRKKLDLQNGAIHITSSGGTPAVTADLRFWIDANHPVVRIGGTSSAKTEIELIIEPWRTERTPATWDRSFTGLADRAKKRADFPFPRFIEPDTIEEGRTDSILWYHRNNTVDHSVWADTLKAQGLEDFMKQSSDPLQHRTYGALVKGAGMTNQSPTILKSTAPATTFEISIHPLTENASTARDWIRKVESLAENDSRMDREAAWAGHKRWWSDFWDRGWIRVDGAPGDDTFVVSQAYALQSWMTACGSRGPLPIKFNGSIFAVDGYEQDKNRGPDYRRWGSAYWFQNTRLPYWPLMTAGQYDLMKPLFKMYMDALPLAKFRVRKYYGFEGAYFPETMYFWGAYTNEDHGWSRKPGQAPDEIPNPFIRYLWSGGIELTAMMLDFYQHTLDKDFLNTTVLPFAREITTFYDKRYPRDDRGKLVIAPGNAQEDIWACSNPMPEVAGLRYILPRLVELASLPADKELYQRMLDGVPDLPKAGSEDGRNFLLPAGAGSEKRRNNCEKPECYALFPFRLYGVGLPDLEMARETFRRSPKTMNGTPRTNGWVQDSIFAACVGDTEGAARRLIERSKLFNENSRFPAFWGPNFDWTPDQCHGGVNMTALQKMLVQTDPHSDKIHLFPAWPGDWNCTFKLHAPGKTVIQGELKNGKLIDLKVTPETRRKDIVLGDFIRQ